ncbi:hypothetical protein L7F22_018795 [Adiantum nelumboides]|nr:hypothetical protein [Adiantum nelumboides]
MESLQSCVQDLDMRSMPQFLDQVSDARENEDSRHFAISLYAELARVHKDAVIPFIPRMMASIVRSLPFSADSQQLHEACAKVITSVARYTIDPRRPHDSNQQILRSLCSPLLPVLSSRLESAAAGAAICLRALVESEKWKFSPSDLQDALCLKATTALVEQGTQGVIFFHLVKSLAKFCKETSKEHVAEWLGVGLEVLQADTAQWQKRLAAAQLITSVLKTAEVQNLGLDLPSIMKILEACMLDKVSVVQTAVAEAFETAKVVGLEKHLVFSTNHKNSALVNTGSINLSCESQRRFLDTEVFSMQDLSSSGSAKSDKSSHEAVPSMASSTVNFASQTKRMKQQGRNLSCLSQLNGSLTKTSILKENTPATLPRRVLSEIPASGKLLSNSDFLPSLGEASSLRRSSMDVKNKAVSQSMQNQGYLSSRKFVQDVRASTLDGAERSASLTKKHVDDCQIVCNTEDGCTADFEKKESVCFGSSAGGNRNINSKEDAKTDEEGNEGGRRNAKVSPECSQKRECLQASPITSKSDAYVGCADSGFFPENSSMESRSKNSSSSGERSPFKVGNSDNPSQDFAFRSPCDLLHSIQGKSSRKGIKQRGKECSKFENKGICWTTSDSLASGESEEDRNFSVNFDSGNATSAETFCRSKLSNMRLRKNHKLSSSANKCSLRNIGESNHRCLHNDSENSDFGKDWPSSRESSDRDVDGNAKARHMHANNKLHKCRKGSGSERDCFANTEGLPKFSAGPDINSRELQNSNRVPISKGQICAGVVLGLLCAIGVLVLAFMVVQHGNQSYGLHLLVPT